MFTAENSKATTQALRKGVDVIEGWLNKVGP